jgi:hypothetical protein
LKSLSFEILGISRPFSSAADKRNKDKERNGGENCDAKKATPTRNKSSSCAKTERKDDVKPANGHVRPPSAHTRNKSSSCAKTERKDDVKPANGHVRLPTADGKDKGIINACRNCMTTFRELWLHDYGTFWYAIIFMIIGVTAETSLHDKVES